MRSANLACYYLFVPILVGCDGAPLERGQKPARTVAPNEVHQDVDAGNEDRQDVDADKKSGEVEEQSNVSGTVDEDEELFVADPPTEFAITLPTTTHSTPTLTWTLSDYAESYDVKVADNEDCADPLFNESDLTVSSIVVTPRLVAGDYFACVVAKNSAGTKLATTAFTVKEGWQDVPASILNPTGLNGRTWGCQLKNETTIIAFAYKELWTYSLDTHSWQKETVVGPEPAQRGWYTQVWTGEKLLIWAGYQNATLTNGIAYDPATKTWVNFTGTNAPPGRHGHVAVWTGKKMIIFGGSPSLSYTTATVNEGHSYDPINDTWQAINTDGAPSLSFANAIWTGKEMLVYGGFSAGAATRAMYSYKPDTDQWTSLGDIGPSNRAYGMGAYIDGRALILGGTTVDQINSTNSDFISFDYAGNKTTDSIALAGYTPGLSGCSLWTGSALFVLGGMNATDNKVRLFYP